MNPKAENHLSDEEIVWAIVDTGRLTTARRQHLLACRQCCRRRDHLAHILESAGQMAADEVPVPTPAPPFGVRRIRKPTVRRFGWRAALAGVAMVLAIFLAVGYYLPIIKRSGLPDSTVAPVADTIDPESWMTEVNELTENALPQVFLDIAGQIEPGLNDEFIDFVVPTEENDNSLGENSLPKGVA